MINMEKNMRNEHMYNREHMHNIFSFACEPYCAAWSRCSTDFPARAAALRRGMICDTDFISNQTAAMGSVPR